MTFGCRLALASLYPMAALCALARLVIDLVRWPT